METLLILAAAAALVLSCLAVAIAVARTRRPPLRLPHEHTIEERGDDLLHEGRGAGLAGILDRTAPVLETRTRPPPAPGLIEHDPEPEGRRDGAAR